MRMDQFYTYKWTFNVWVQVILNDSNGTVTYQLDRSQNGNLASGLTQSYLFTKEPLEIAALIRDVKNPSGDAPFVIGEDETDMYVNSCDPLLDAFGRLRGYRSTLRRTQPTVVGV